MFLPTLTCFPVLSYFYILLCELVERCDIVTLHTVVVSYDEFLSHDLAKAILGKDYDPECSYKLLTEVAQTTVLKIDPRIPEDAEPVADDNGVIVVSVDIVELFKRILSHNDRRRVVATVDDIEFLLSTSASPHTKQDLSGVYTG